MNGDLWGVVIDTDAYAGNFERELCAYTTGQLGECGVGDEAQALFLEDGCDPAPFNSNVAQVPDDEETPCHRPVGLYPTPGRWNNGMGKCFDDAEHEEGQKKYDANESVVIWFHEEPTDEQVALIKERAEAFIRDERKWSSTSELSDGLPRKILGFRMVKKQTEVTVGEL